MEKKLFIVVNQTNKKFSFVNTESAQDNMEIKPCAASNLPSINLTSGQHGAGCDIPDCSDEKYYAEHHMEFNEKDGAHEKYCFWYDDSKDQYYYTKTDSFTDSNVIPGNVSASAPKKAIYIRDDNTLFITDVNE